MLNVHFSRTKLHARQAWLLSQNDDTHARSELYVKVKKKLDQQRLPKIIAREKSFAIKISFNI